MFRVPRYFIFLFVGLSIAIAFLIHRGRQFDSKDQASVSFSSKSGLEQLGFDRLGSRSTLFNSEASQCDCLRSEAQPFLKELEFEDEASCASNRKDFEISFGQLSRLFRDERSKGSVEFPRACLLYMLNQSRFDPTFHDSAKIKICRESADLASEKMLLPCMTTMFVNTLFNLFGDVTDCLDVPQRDLVPKIFAASGFLPNALAEGGAAGLSQLTKAMNEDIQHSFAKHRHKALISDKASCQRLAPFLRKIDISQQISDSCSQLARPETIVQDFFSLSVFYLHSSERIEGQMNELRIVQRLAAAGLASKDYDIMQLRKILISISTALGVDRTMRLFVEFLKQSETSKRRLQLADFDFSKPAMVSQFAKFISGSEGPSALKKIERAARLAEKMNLVFKEGVCVPDSFMAL